MRRLLTALFILLATKSIAEDITLVCETSSESSTILGKNGKVIMYDDKIVTQKPTLVIGANTLKADFLLFDIFKCDNLSVNYSEDEIKALCVGTSNFSGNKFPAMSKSVTISRYSGAVSARLTNDNDDGSLFFYNYEGICKKSKKLF